MRSLLLLSNFILYSNLWIALAAVCMSLQTQYILSGSVRMEAYHGLLFCGTLSLYAVHRLIGLQKVLSVTQEGRFAVIRQLKALVLILAVISAIGTFWFMVQLTFSLLLWMLPAAIASATYVLPIFKNKQRLRDYNYIKIFLIAIVWAWLTAFLPAMILHEEAVIPLIAISLERLFFIFAITLPFDIRDLKIDSATRVKTLPATIGIAATKKLAYWCLFLMMSCSLWMLITEVYSPGVFGGILSCALLCLVLIKNTTVERPDYYFTGFLDGTMIAQLLFVLLGAYLEATSFLS